MSVLAVVVASALLVAGCGGSSGAERTSSAAVTAAATATAAPGVAPTPEHLTFAAGQTISADGKAGIFFLDPYTGAADAWVVPTNGVPDTSGYYSPFHFSVGGFSADRSRVVYTCKASGTSGLEPCEGGPTYTWYMLHTETGGRTTLAGFTGDFASISPDGSTLIGRTGDGIGVARASEPSSVRPVSLPEGAAGDLSQARADWSADGSRVVLTAGMQARSTTLIDTEEASATALAVSPAGAAWSPDGMQFALGRDIDKDRSELAVVDRDGEEIWSKPIAAGGVGGVWSGDGRYLYAEEREAPAADGFGPLDRVIVLDASTGATAYRIRGGFCPTGWAGTSHTLLTGSYGFGQVVADLDAGALRVIDEYAMPVPFDDTLAILFNGSDFSSYDLTTGAKKLIAQTTVSPAWDPNHEPLFAGERLAFTALHGGHGGCGEGQGPKDPPQPELLVGPFGDDAPVTRGGVH